MKLKHLLQVMLALVVTAACFISSAGAVYARADEMTALSGSADDLHSFTVSDSSPDLGERITLSAIVDAPEGKEMSGVSYDVMTGGSGIGMSDWVNEDFTTHSITVTVTANYLGKYGFSCILVRYADGSSTLYYDPTMVDADNLPYPADETVAVDMSGSFAQVEGEDHSAPEFDPDSLMISNTTPMLGETVVISVAVSDDTAVGTTGNFEYEVNGSRMGIPAYYSKETGRLSCDLTLNSIGEYHLVDFSVIDAGNNKSMLLNSQSVSYTDILSTESSSTNILTTDLSGFNFNIDEITDDVAPVVYLETLSVSSGKTARMEHVNVSVSIEEDNGLQEAYLQFAFNDRNGMGGSLEAVPDSDLYSFTVVPAYYGTCHLYSMLLIDTAGNTVYYVDESLRNYDWSTPGSPYFKQDSYWDQVQFVDLSVASFEVGARELSTGIYAFGNGMGEDASLSVIELPQSGTIFDSHVNSEMEVIGYYELEMSGTFSDSQNNTVRVDFPVQEEDGTAVKIDHVLADGSTQTVTTTVKNGIASIEVTEFSPFLLQKGKSMGAFEESKNEELNAGDTVNGENMENPEVVQGNSESNNALTDNNKDNMSSIPAENTESDNKGKNEDSAENEKLVSEPSITEDSVTEETNTLKPAENQNETQEPTDNTTPANQKPNTGERSHVAVWIMGALGSLLGLIIKAVSHKKVR